MSKSYTKITQEEGEFLTKFYPTTSLKFCSEKLPHLSSRQILYFLSINKIYKVGSFVKTCDVEIFKNPTSPEVAYFLGLIWADGHISRKNSNYESVILKVQERDGWEFYRMFEDLARFKINKCPRNDGQDQLSIKIHNSKLATYLASVDFSIKSQGTPTKVLATIPGDLHRFFWLGFFDGDGHLMVSKKKKPGVRDVGTMGFSGPYEQDWSDLISFLDDFRCSFYINRNIMETGRNSQLCIFRASDINHLGSLFYQTYEQDGIGLPRKYAKYMELKADIESKRKITGVYFSKYSFEAKFGLGYKNIYLGRHKIKENAMLAYDLKAVEILGHRAFTNFPLSNYLTIGTRYWEEVEYLDKFSQTTLT